MRRMILFAASLAACALPGLASATILTFDVDNGRPDQVVAMDQSYGDNVAQAIMNNASYGVGTEGFTPDVSVSYRGVDAATGADYTDQLTRWTNDFGDLYNVFEDEADTNTVNTITFTADAGHTVSLFGFDMAGFAEADYTIQNLAVLVDGASLYDMDGVHIDGAADGGPQHSTFGWAAPFTGQTITIRITPGLGGDSDNIGIDNIRFGEGVPAVDTGSVPEPATWATMMGGFGLVGGALRRRARVPAIA